jgi:hypothetical protein
MYRPVKPLCVKKQQRLLNAWHFGNLRARKMELTGTFYDPHTSVSVKKN